MIPYEQFQPPVGLVNFIKKENQRKGIANYIKKHGIEPDSETALSFFVATEEQIDKARLECYSLMLAKEINNQSDGQQDDVPVDYNEMPLTFEILSDGELSWNLDNKVAQFSKDGWLWRSIDSGTTISVRNGERIMFRGNNTNYFGNAFRCTANFNAIGNIMSLTNMDSYSAVDEVNDDAFGWLFASCSTLLSAKKMKLPALFLRRNCYSAMFMNCSYLIDSPELPATVLGEACYSNMFTNCVRLTNAPELPATQLHNKCYSAMFSGCYSLTKAPVLPAKELVSECYKWMFMDSGVSYIKAMFGSGDYSYEGFPCHYTEDWVKNVAQSGTFVMSTDAAISQQFIEEVRWDSGIPKGWTVELAQE